MGLLDGIMGAISPAINVATSAAGAYQGAQANAAAMQREQMLQAIMMRRQQQQFESEQAQRAASTNLSNRNAGELRSQDPGYADFQGRLAGVKAEAEVAPHVQQAVQTEQQTSPIKTQQAIDTARGVAPIHTQEAISTAAGVAPIHTQEAINTAAGVAPIHTQEAVNTEKATLPTKLTLERAKQGMTPLNSDESSAATQLPMMALGLQGMQKLPAPNARSQWANSGGFWKNYLSTPQGRQFMQAANQTAIAAAIATEGPRGGQPNRVAMLQHTYIPAAGDDDATAEQKMNNLKSLIKSATTRAGRGYQRIPDATRNLIESVSAGAPGSGTQTAGDNPFAALIPKQP